MDKIKVKICVGTTCFVMGASELQELENFLPVEMLNKVEVTGNACLGICKNGNYGSAPFVTVDDEVISNATIDTVLEKIKEKLT